MKAKLLLRNCFIISQLVLGIVDCVFTLNEKIDQWFMKIDNPKGTQQISELYSKYIDLFNAVEQMKDKTDKLRCEVKLNFGGYWLLKKAKKNKKQNVVDSLIRLKDVLNVELKKGFGTDLKIPKDEIAFTHYYTVKKNEISKLLEEKKPDWKQAVKSVFKSDSRKQVVKLAFKLVSTAYMQIDMNKSKINFSDLRSALEDINKMKKTFSRSNGIFDALSFYICVLYSNWIVESELSMNEKIDQLYMEVDQTTQFRQMSIFYRDYGKLFDIVAKIKDETEKLTCEVKLKFGGYWLLRKAMENRQDEAFQIITKNMDTLDGNLEKRFGIRLKIQENEIVCTDEIKNAISKLLEENAPDCKQAEKLAFDLVSTAYKQFDIYKSKNKLADLRSALEYINKMKKKFPQSSGFFDALSFYLCILYSNLIIYHAEIPKDFKDPITDILMEYPVKMPDNKTVDRTTIIQNNYENAFNRESLGENQLDPEENLRNRITEWKVKTFKLHKIERKNSLECILFD